jgi:hypothetical protein
VESRIRFDPTWILALMLTVFAVAPLSYPGFFETQSGFLPNFKLENLSAAPNWAWPAGPQPGEGKLPYLFAWPFLQITGSGLAAIKWGYALAVVLAALGVYTWTRPWLGVRGAVLASVVYTYLPWHLSAVYVRGAYAEAWLWAFWPFLLWAIDRLGPGGPRNTLVGIAAGLPLLAATFWTQPGLAALAVPFLAAYGVTAPTKQRWSLLRLVEAVALSLLLLWIAARRLPEARLAFGEHFLYPFQLLSAAWGDDLSFQLGIASVGLSIITMALLLSRGTRDKTEASSSSPSRPMTRAAWFWVAALLILILLCLPLSAWFWQITGLDAFLTYPWQLLALTGLPLAFLAGAVIRLEARLATLPAWAGLVALVVLASYPYLAPRFTQVDPGSEPVAVLQPVGAEAPQIMLLDYDLVPPTEIRPTLTLTLTWQALEPISGDHTIFVHALAEDAKIAQRDTRPCDGECPTTSWEPGRIILDRYQLDLPPDAATEPDQLAVGLYLLDSGERATVVGRDDNTVFIDVPQ